MPTTSFKLPVSEMPRASAIYLISALLDKAYGADASDIHLDPVAIGMRVRFRIDGNLVEQPALPHESRAEIISRIKVLAGLRTDEHFAAQDGRFRYEASNRRFADIRVSITPTYHGENAVLRILADNAQSIALESLGFAASDRERIVRSLARRGGMILAAGPTGSGKTTTLYALLRLLHSPEVSIVTIEDPVEYAIEGVRQIQAQSQTGLTFARGLRAVLRQDPDIIMVGEIRDRETATVAVQTALTGHLLLSTLHTNDTAAALPRLYDLGVESYLIASTLQLVVAQRLVRALCEACRKRARLSEPLAHRFKATIHDAWSEAPGCDICRGTGYRGRIAVVETLVVDEAIRSAILAAAPQSEIRRLAIAGGMRLLRDDGIEKARLGLTSLSEILSAL